MNRTPDPKPGSKADGKPTNKLAQQMSSHWTNLRMPFALGLLTTFLSTSARLSVAPDTWGSGGWVACIVAGCLAAAAVRNAGQA